MFFLLCQRISLMCHPTHGTCLLSTHLLFINSFPPWLSQIGCFQWTKFPLQSSTRGHYDELHIILRYSLSAIPHFLTQTAQHHLTQGPYFYGVGAIPFRMNCTINCPIRDKKMSFGQQRHKRGIWHACECGHRAHTFVATVQSLAKHYPECVQWHADFQRY